jgi:hypothetical protein
VALAFGAAQGAIRVLAAPTEEEAMSEENHSERLPTTASYRNEKEKA